MARGYPKAPDICAALPAGCRSDALPASTHPRESGVLPTAVTGQGDYTPEELVMREAYWREQMADALTPTTDTRH